MPINFRFGWRSTGILPVWMWLGVLVVLSVSTAKAERSTSFEFLNLPASARTSALGGAGVAEAKGWAGAQINPAGLGRLRRDEVAFSSARWIDDVNYHSAGYAHPFLNGGALSGSIVSVDYGDIAAFSPTGGPEGTTGAKDTGVRLGYGRSWRDRLQWGIQGVYARENLAGETAQSLAADGGVLWAPFLTGPLRTLSVGGALRNWGQGPRSGDKTEPLPRTIQAGLNLCPFIEGASLSLDEIFSPTQSPSFVAGAEYWARGAVALRLGYNGLTAREGSGLTMGLGFRAWDLEVDYSFIGYGDLGETHHVGLTYRFGQLAEKHYALGLVSLQKKDYAEAVIHFAQSVSVDPKNRRALEKLREANTLLQNQAKPTVR